MAAKRSENAIKKIENVKRGRMRSRQKKNKEKLKRK